MLISFALENWKSYREPVKLSLADAGCPRNGRVIPRIEKYNAGLVPLLSIYGGNASGKSNFIEAIDFVKSLVVDGVEKKGLQAEPFSLDQKTKELPSNFKFELLVDEVVYEYVLSILRNTVQSESLFKVGIDFEREPLFERDKQNIKFGNKLDTEFLKKVAESTLEHRLFLSHCANFNLEEFQPIYDWFDKSLLVIRPESKFVATHKLMESNSPLVNRINNALFMLGTGVIGINQKLLSPSFVDTLITDEFVSKDELKKHGPINLDIGDRKISLSFENGEIRASRLVSQHRTITGEIVDYDISQESDGTIRLIDIIPAFLELTQNTSSFLLVIDELDRSLHSFLTKSLILSYLKLCNQDSRMQLIYTTHDTSLIEELPICNDEICVTDRDMDGITQIVSLGDFKDIKPDDNILKLYKNGRLGGVPIILFKNTAINPFDKSDFLEE